MLTSIWWQTSPANDLPCLVMSLIPILYGFLRPQRLKYKVYNIPCEATHYHAKLLGTYVGVTPYIYIPKETQ